MAGISITALAVEGLPAPMAPTRAGQWWDNGPGEQAAPGEGRCEWGPIDHPANCDWWWGAELLPSSQALREPGGEPSPNQLPCVGWWSR